MYWVSFGKVFLLRLIVFCWLLFCIFFDYFEFEVFVMGENFLGSIIEDILWILNYFFGLVLFFYVY